MSHRAHISLKTKLASTLCQMLRDDGAGNLVPVIPYADAKMMTEDQVLSLFHFDHDPIAKHVGGPDAHWNLKPRPIPEHRQKTASIDVPQAARAARLSEGHKEFQRRMLAKSGQADTPTPERQSKGRAISGARRSGWKHKLTGEWIRR